MLSKFGFRGTWLREKKSTWTNFNAIGLPIKLGGGGHRKVEITVLSRGAPDSIAHPGKDLKYLDIDPDIARLSNSLGGILGENIFTRDDI